MALRKQEPADNEDELKSLHDLEFALRDPENNPPKIVTAYGTTFKIPESIIHALRQIVHYQAYGGGFTILPTNKEVTTQEAAEILHISRPYVVKLLEEGKIPYKKVGTHRRIPLDAVLEFDKKYHEMQRRGLDEIIRIGEEILAENDDPRLR